MKDKIFNSFKKIILIIARHSKSASLKAKLSEQIKNIQLKEHENIH